MAGPGFMKCFVVIVFVFCGSLSFGQVKVNGPWSLAGGIASNSLSDYTGFNLRYSSPRFRWSEEWEGDEEKIPEKFKNMRFMFELIYKAPIKTMASSFNVQYRLIHYKRFSFEIYGGLKFFFMSEPSFIVPPRRKGHKGDIWYMNMGLLTQLNLGVISPFVDFGGDGLFTAGSEFNFHAIYRKTKRRYKLKGKE